ncbi:uncharacterized protein RHOBADRAFT_54638 [Rhodotorula graminis WP1]|uniref:Coiled-coil domain-containing protein 130 n=1 Tax=Rhodotorula graminis (strain WP1) TaxID=578459 RepID=A0A0N8Q042_RHOGW|nr:uncharacterized protein RHOBADRAFT_54638 [Rhodotorula graminis WP1]KPV74077.1 hypothetical protein RHOBADRAFT_54638 [Rhodotorula graminis WP1]
MASTHSASGNAHKADQGILVVRFELPYNIWCGTCNAHIGQGVRYNAEKSKVGMYHSTPILAFRFKCHLCQGRIEIRTDPQNTRYVVTEGAKQKNEEWDPEENGHLVIDNAASTSTAPPDPFASLEKTVTQRAAALTAAERLHALEEHNSARWSDPFAASRALRASFRDKKARIVRSEKKAEDVRERFGLADERVHSTSSPALKALHSRLSLATALKRDPFGGAAAAASSSPARSDGAAGRSGAGAAGLEGVKVRRRS